MKYNIGIIFSLILNLSLCINSFINSDYSQMIAWLVASIYNFAYLIK